MHELGQLLFRPKFSLHRILQKPFLAAEGLIPPAFGAMIGYEHIIKGVPISLSVEVDFAQIPWNTGREDKWRFQGGIGTSYRNRFLERVGVTNSFFRPVGVHRSLTLAYTVDIHSRSANQHSLRLPDFMGFGTQFGRFSLSGGLLQDSMIAGPDTVVYPYYGAVGVHLAYNFGDPNFVPSPAARQLQRLGAAFAGGLHAWRVSELMTGNIVGIPQLTDDNMQATSIPLGALNYATAAANAAEYVGNADKIQQWVALSVGVIGMPLLQMYALGVFKRSHTNPRLAGMAVNAGCAFAGGAAGGLSRSYGLVGKTGAKRITGATMAACGIGQAAGAIGALKGIDAEEAADPELGRYHGEPGDTEGNNPVARQGQRDERRTAWYEVMTAGLGPTAGGAWLFFFMEY